MPTILSKTAIIISILIASTTTAEAQDDPLYKREIGIGVGMTNYLGDFNGSLTKGMKPQVNLVFRHNFSPYSGLKIDASYCKIEGSSANSTSYYPEYADAPYTFSRNLMDLNVSYEYNFWPYGTGRDYRGAVRCTPYISLGLGATLATGEGESTATANLPLGFGVKYKATRRLNIALEWTFHPSASDKLDGAEAPLGIESTGIFKNTDCYSSLRLMLTYSFSQKCKTCNKDY